MAAIIAEGGEYNFGSWRLDQDWSHLRSSCQQLGFGHSPDRLELHRRCRRDGFDQRNLYARFLLRQSAKNGVVECVQPDLDRHWHRQI